MKKRGDNADDKMVESCYRRDNLAEETTGVNPTEPSVRPMKTVGIHDKKIWRVRDVAEFLGCSTGHVYRLASDEKIPKIKKGKFVYFMPESIHNWVLEGDQK
ncbi:MAG: helix-turn-helix domain-containing protein [Bacteriovoracales bacterium]|nr:helix-turn-helix domain-containing protein [Bacteriovoracales bacterium]